MNLRYVLLTLKYLFLLLLNSFRRYPVNPNITSYRIVELRTGDIAAKAEKQEPFDIPLTRKTVTVQVGQTSALSDDCEVVKVSKDGVTREKINKSITYSGTVINNSQPGSIRLTITPNVITGYIMLDDQVWLIDPLDNYVSNADPHLYVIYRGSDVRFVGHCGNDEPPPQDESTEEPITIDEKGTQRRTLALHELEILNIAMVADDQFMGGATFRNRLSWMEIQQSLIDQVNGIFETQLGISLRIKGHFQFDTVDLTFASTDSTRLLDELKENWTATFGDLSLLARRQGMRIDLAHLTTGKNLDGSTIGRAFRPGVYGVSEVSRDIRGSSPFSCTFSNVLLLAHEIGHNFNAVHAEADEFCVTHFIGCLDFERTIMFPTLECDTRPNFSDGSHDSTNNNNRRIKTHVHTGRNVDL